MLHLIKLAVGISDLDHLREVQARRAAERPPLCHRTRNFPRRAEEIVAGGSMYWVVSRVIAVRQRVLAVEEDAWDDGSACAALVLDPALVPVLARPMKPFQGWRYMAAADAPPDRVAGPEAEGADGLPPRLRRELEALCLL
jgi:hypothetical protein